MSDQEDEEYPGTEPEDDASVDDESGTLIATDEEEKVCYLVTARGELLNKLHFISDFIYSLGCVV